MFSKTLTLTWDIFTVCLKVREDVICVKNVREDVGNVFFDFSTHSLTLIQ